MCTSSFFAGALTVIFVIMAVIGITIAYSVRKEKKKFDELFNKKEK